MILPPERRSGEPNPDCQRCGGSGFIMLIDYDGPGLHDEDNCPCTRGECDCDACEAEETRS